MRATGVGSMPGEDCPETLRVIRGELADLLFIPELPDRGVHAGMIGRSLALLDGLAADLQPAGWRLVDASGVDHRRARSLLAQDLDAVEEQWSDHGADTTAVSVKQQVTGPWTLAATVELMRGEKVQSDHGARRDLASSLAAGVGAHVADLRRRLPHAEIVVQVDEPLLPAVLAAQVGTASGLATYRAVDAPQADAALRGVVDAVHAAGARSVVHSCAPDVPVALLAGAGFEALSFDLALARPDDVWSEVFESGTALWPGVVPTLEAVGEKQARERLARFMDRLGFGAAEHGDRLVLTPACGLAGAPPSWARDSLSMLARMARDLSQTT